MKLEKLEYAIDLRKRIAKIEEHLARVKSTNEKDEPCSCGVFIGVEEYDDDYGGDLINTDDTPNEAFIKEFIKETNKKYIKVLETKLSELIAEFDNL